MLEILEVASTLSAFSDGNALSVDRALEFYNALRRVRHRLRVMLNSRQYSYKKENGNNLGSLTASAEKGGQCTLTIARKQEN